jgi:single-stranded-DNA-specific exonuclease
MKYKLIDNNVNFSNNDYDLVDMILLNRGVSYPNKYLKTTDADLIPYNLLSNIDEASKCLLTHIENNDNICILMDNDLDGVCSSAILYQYLKETFPSINLQYIMSEGKQHGLSNSVKVPENVNLLLLPDSGSNDSKQCKVLKEKGVDIIVLDHHEKNVQNDYAIIVNPFYSENYENKSLSGGAVVYKFIKNIDESTWNDNADKYLDLVALSLIADSMDLRTLENRRLIELGLSNVKNKAFLALINKQSYSMNNEVNIINCMFYISPLCNATIRTGEMEDKKNLFEAFCQIYQEFDYTKNSKTETVKEDIYTRVARVATNLRAKQNREIDKGLEIINQDIEKYNRNSNKVLFANCNGLDSNYVGLVAMKLASQYSKPCILIHESERSADYYTGSMRNYNNSPIENFKQFIEETKLFDFVQGHAGASGVGLKKQNIKKAIEFMNEKLKDVDFDKFYRVDFIMSPEEITLDFVQKLDKLKGVWCGTIEEPCILVKNVRVNTNDIELMGKESDSFKFRLNDDYVQCMAFKRNSDDPILKIKEEEPLGTWVELEAVVKVNMNSFNQISSPQAVIQDYNLIKKG